MLLFIYTLNILSAMYGYDTWANDEADVVTMVTLPINVAASIILGLYINNETGWGW